MAWASTSLVARLLNFWRVQLLQAVLARKDRGSAKDVRIVEKDYVKGMVWTKTN